MRTWALRIIGLLSILFAIVVLLFELVVLWPWWGRLPGSTSATRTDWVVFALLLAISIYLVVHPARYGIRLIKQDESALLPCAVLFAAQILAYLLTTWIGFSLPRSMNGIVFGLWEFAILPIQYAVLFGPSVLGLIVTLTLFLSRRARKKDVVNNAMTSETLAGE
jgi:hypothetical protein